jgi:ribonuclease BN (tRNA processing enzyme)
MLDLTFLGSGNAFASTGRYWSSFLLNQRYLFDVPPTALAHLKRLGRPPADIRVVFITHFHGDHFMGLPFLLLEYVHLSPRRDDLYIVGPPGVEAFLEEFASRCYPGLADAEVDYRRIYLEADPDREQTVDELSFRAVAMNHASGKLDCFGYRVAARGKTVAYTGDSEYGEPVLALAQGSDVLVADCTYSQGSGPDHMGLDDIRRLRKAVDPATAIILTHLDGDPDTQGLDNVIVAEDLATYHFD